MLRLLLLLIVVAGVAGYFTRPDEAKMRAGAEAALNGASTLTQGLQNIGVALAGQRQYDNYYVAAKYTVALDGNPLVECWGAFQQVRCQRPAHAQS